MSSRWIVLIVILAFVALGVGCERAEQAAQDAEGAVGQAAAAVGDAVEDVSSEMGNATSDLMQRAEQAVQNLDSEAKALYDNVSNQLTSKQDELKGLKQKIAGMSPQELLSGDGKAMKDNAEMLTTEIGGLKTQLEGLIAKAG